MRLGNYEVLEEIGRGGMGIVYRGYDPFIGREVALKTINLFSIVDPEERDELQQRLHREAQSAGRLSHPNIVTIYHVGYAELEPGRMGAFIAMEFVPGVNLESLIRSFRQCPPPVAIGYLRQAAAALDHAHSRGVIHRDVKPSNLIVTPEGVVKIADFGVAKVLSQKMTQTGAAVGSPHYMSPEQIRGDPLDGRSDQYSLAVVAYEVLTGRKPFEAPSLSALWYKIATEYPPPPDLSPPDLSRRIAPVLFRALSKDPAGRFATCSEFVEHLAAAVFGSARPEPARQTAVHPLPGSLSDESPDRAPGPKRARSGGKLASVAAGSTAVAAALAVFLFLLARGRSPAPVPSTPPPSPQAMVMAAQEDLSLESLDKADPGSGERQAPAALSIHEASGSPRPFPVDPEPRPSLAAARQQGTRQPATGAGTPLRVPAPAAAVAGSAVASNAAGEAGSGPEAAASGGAPGSQSLPHGAGSRNPSGSVPHPNPILRTAPQPEAVPLNYSIAPAPTPQPCILPAGAGVTLRLARSINTKNARVGDVVFFRTVAPVTMDDRTIIPADSLVLGRVVLAERSGRVAGSAELRIRLETLLLPNGVRKNLQATLGSVEVEGKDPAVGPEGTLKAGTSRRRDAAMAATAVAAGGIASRSVEGLVVGAAAGLIAILLTRGPDLELPQGALFRMTLHEPLHFGGEELAGLGPAAP